MPQFYYIRCLVFILITVSFPHFSQAVPNRQAGEQHVVTKKKKTVVSNSKKASPKKHLVSIPIQFKGIGKVSLPKRSRAYVGIAKQPSQANQTVQILKSNRDKIQTKQVVNIVKVAKVGTVKSTNKKAARNILPVSGYPLFDHLGVHSSSALVFNEETGNVFYQKNSDQPRPIASITKLMTAMTVLDSRLPLGELIAICKQDADSIKGTSSRLAVGTLLTRGELLLLALMSSENRAAAALARAYPGGRVAFIKKMNEKARKIGMNQTRFFDPTGLNPGNVASPRDLALMVSKARTYSEIRRFSTAIEYSFVSSLTGKTLVFRNTNPLVEKENWEIDISKTGFINEAGHCIVMRTTINETPVVMVLLHSQGKYTRIGDAQRVKKWLETGSVGRV